MFCWCGSVSVFGGEEGRVWLCVSGCGPTVHRQPCPALCLRSLGFLHPPKSINQSINLSIDSPPTTSPHNTPTQYEVVDVDEDSRVYALPETQVRVVGMNGTDGSVERDEVNRRMESIDDDDNRRRRPPFCPFIHAPQHHHHTRRRMHAGDPPAARVRGAKAQVPARCVLSLLCSAQTFFSRCFTRSSRSPSQPSEDGEKAQPPSPPTPTHPTNHHTPPLPLSPNINTQTINQTNTQSGDEVFAVYPETTSFYLATIAQPPRRGSSGPHEPPRLAVQFQDDADEMGVTPIRYVNVEYVFKAS